MEVWVGLVVQDITGGVQEIARGVPKITPCVQEIITDVPDISPLVPEIRHKDPPPFTTKKPGIPNPGLQNFYSTTSNSPDPSSDSTSPEPKSPAGVKLPEGRSRPSMRRTTSSDPSAVSV